MGMIIEGKGERVQKIVLKKKSREISLFIFFVAG